MWRLTNWEVWIVAGRFTSTNWGHCILWNTAPRHVLLQHIFWGSVICPYVMKLPPPVVFYIHGTKANPKFMGVNPSAGNIAFRLIETCGHYTALSNISVHPHSGLHWRSFISKRSHRSRISFQHSYPFRICRSRFIAVRNPSCSNLHRLSFIRLVWGLLMAQGWQGFRLRFQNVCEFHT